MTIFQIKSCLLCSECLTDVCNVCNTCLMLEVDAFLIPLNFLRDKLLLSLQTLELV